MKSGRLRLALDYAWRWASNPRRFWSDVERGHITLDKLRPPMRRSEYLDRLAESMYSHDWYCEACGANKMPGIVHRCPRA